MSPSAPPRGKPFRHFLAFIFCSFCSMSAIAAAGCQLISTGSAAEAGHKPAAQRWIHEEPEGSAESPLRLEPKSGMRLALTIVAGQPCFLHMALNLPSLITYRIDAPSDIRSVAMEMTASSTKQKQIMTGEQLVSSEVTFRFRYTLPAVSYQMKVIATSKSASQGPVRILLAIDEMKPDAPAFSLDAGEAEVVLDPVSRTAFRQFMLERSGLVRFSLSNVPSMGEGVRQISINLRKASGDLALQVEGSGPSDKHKYAAYILAPGRYFVEVDGSYNGWPSPPLQEPARSTRIGLHLDSIAPYTVPPSMIVLSAWLKQTGLGELMEFVELTDFRRASRNLPGAYSRNFPTAATVARNRTLQRLCKAAPAQCDRAEILTDKTVATPGAEVAEKLAWPAGSVEADRPAIAVTFQVLKDRWTVGATEEAFYKEHQVALWNRLLQKISNLEAISTRQIVVFVPVSCSAGLVYMDEGNTARRHGSECMSGSAFTPLGVAAALNAATEETLAHSSQGLAKAVRPFLTKFLGDKNASFDFLTLDPEYVEVIIRGLRGQVVNGGHDWEKLQLTVSITGKDPRMLRASLDGQLASGIGNYPADSQFTRDMDVQFKGNVTEYSKKLVTALRAFLEAKP